MPLVFTGIETADEGETTSVTVTWQSRKNRQYAVFRSTDLKNWIELTDDQESGGESTFYTDSGLAKDIGRVYYRVEERPL